MYEDIETGDYVRIDWPDGTMLLGVAHVDKKVGIVSLGFGPADNERRWMVIGQTGKPHYYALRGAITIIQKAPSQTALF